MKKSILTFIILFTISMIIGCGLVNLVMALLGLEFSWRNFFIIWLLL